ncbi:hypothetical protein L873DRAFT_1845431 [Choiromyces venosus 120613-1]|uniref:Uncharacterized protein n=1 Tax=Choiromyces venosus 120613-1 TaxID=1336337 RepID=A0A3N4JDE6_9PEZI|nr:hypothetical protein L873DRAFT_1845431 [Choiromyces venosus 120613-1]
MTLKNKSLWLLQLYHRMILLPWIDWEEIGKFFESRTRDECETAKRKYSNATNLVEARKKRLAECTRKRKDAERLEEEGRLLKHRKTGAALLQEEGYLVQQISEAERKVKKFERHMEDLARTSDLGSCQERRVAVQLGDEFNQEELEESALDGEEASDGEETCASPVPTGGAIDISISL